MIDTIILTVPWQDYQILDHNQFNPPTHRVHEAGNMQTKHMNNALPSERKEGVYKPRLTIRRRYDAGSVSIPLKIEFSVPKLLFGNNVDELAESDFETAIRRLQQVLLTMSIRTTADALRRAGVSALHVAKNVPLSSGYTASYVIKELSKVNLTRKLDLSQTDFRNEGKSLQYYAVSHSFVLYDKISDLNQSKGRAIDKEQLPQQFSLFEELREERLELLRLEVRLSNRTKLKSVLAAVGYSDQPTFASVFKRDLWQQVLLKYWQDLIASHNLFLFDKIGTAQATLRNIFDAQPDIKPKQAIYLMGLQLLAKEIGARELRKLLEEQAVPRTWQRISKDLRDLSAQARNTSLCEYIRDIEECLSRFEPYRRAKTENVSFLM
jgi:AraC-like DNA-binding protein